MIAPPMHPSRWTQVKTIVAEAMEFAKTSPEPDPSELYTDVYLEAAQ